MKKVERVHIIFLIVVPLERIAEGTPIEGAVGQIAPRLFAFFAGDAFALRVEGRKPAVGADVKGAVHVFGALLAFEIALDRKVVDIEFLLNDCCDLLFGKGAVFFGLHDARNIHAHFALPHIVRPAGLHAVAAFDADEGDGQAQELDEPADRGVDVLRPAAVSAVSLGRDGDRAALFGDFEARHHGAHVRRLLADGDGPHRPLEHARDKAVGEEVLARHIVDGPQIHHAHEELVEGGLMVAQKQIGPLPGALHALHFGAVPQLAEGREEIDERFYDAVPCSPPSVFALCVFFCLFGFFFCHKFKRGWGSGEAPERN